MISGRCFWWFGFCELSCLVLILAVLVFWLVCLRWLLAWFWGLVGLIVLAVCVLCFGVWCACVFWLPLLVGALGYFEFVIGLVWVAC